MASGPRRGASSGWWVGVDEKDRDRARGRRWGTSSKESSDRLDRFWASRRGIAEIARATVAVAVSRSGRGSTRSERAGRPAPWHRQPRRAERAQDEAYCRLRGAHRWGSAGEGEKGRGGGGPKRQPMRLVRGSRQGAARGVARRAERTGAAGRNAQSGRGGGAGTDGNGRRARRREAAKTRTRGEAPLCGRCGTGGATPQDEGEAPGGGAPKGGRAGACVDRNAACRRAVSSGVLLLSTREEERKERRGDADVRASSACLYAACACASDLARASVYACASEWGRREQPGLERGGGGGGAGESGRRRRPGGRAEGAADRGGR